MSLIKLEKELNKNCFLYVCIVYLISCFFIDSDYCGLSMIIVGILFLSTMKILRLINKGNHDTED